jgi:hypothetical protein
MLSVVIHSVARDEQILDAGSWMLVKTRDFIFVYPASRI